MVKEIAHPLPAILRILLLLVSVTMSASAQGYFVEGEIKWANRLGVVPAAPGDSKPSASPCSIFSVVALDARTKRPVAYTDQGASPFRYSFFQSAAYACKYSLKVPENRDLYIMATMGNVQLLPKTDRDPYLIRDPWISPYPANQPPAGSERSLTGATFVRTSMGVVGEPTSRTVDFRLGFINSGASENAIPVWFAGAWQAKFGQSIMMLLLQQDGYQVTGQLRVNSADFGVVREGSIVGNKLSFKIVRAGRARPNGLNLPEFVGTGELVMDEGATSFTGTILGTATTGTFVGR